MVRRSSGVAVICGFTLLCGIALAPSRTIAQTMSAGSAQGYPARPIRVIVPNTAGSAMDTVARMIGQRLTEAWGQQIVVDARPGAGGIIGHEIAAKAAADGYTLLFTSSAGVVINPLLSKLKILADPTLARWLADQGLDPAPGSPAALAAYMRSETERFSHIIKVAGLATAQ